MTTPTVHLNGSGRESLMEMYREAYSKLGDALRSLSDACPNARDYYVQGPDAFEAARREHQARYAAVSGAQNDMLELFEAVQS